MRKSHFLSLVLLVSACRSSPLEPGACSEEQLATGCTIGRCTISAPSGALPEGSIAVAREVDVPPELAADVVGTTMCAVTLPASPRAPLTLTMALDAPSDAALFRLTSDTPPTLVPAETSPGSAVSGLLSASGRYGVTRMPGNWRVAGERGIDPGGSADTASLLRNLSRRRSEAAFFDGKNFFLGNGPRLLIYDGMPGPSAKPRVVLGQPDLDHDLTGASASVFDGAVTGIWSNGTRLFASTGNRVLVWNRIPDANFAPADAVLGQPDFSSAQANTGGTSAVTLNSPSQIDSDGKRLLVGDAVNNRVLVWDPIPNAISAPATYVIGQPSFTSDILGSGATPITVGWGASFDGDGAFIGSAYHYGFAHVPSARMNNPTPDFRPLDFSQAVLPYTIGGVGHVMRLDGGGLAVRDTNGYRVGIYKAAPKARAPIDVAVGQPDASHVVVGPVTASSLTVGGRASISLGGSSTGMLVPDAGYRVLVWEKTPTYHFQPADRVIGQPGFTTLDRSVDYRGVGARTLAYPADVQVAPGSGDVAVADRGNNRVVLYPAAAASMASPAASVILGQPDERGYIPNVDQKSASASTMSGPSGVALDGQHLIVADTENHRVLVWNKVPTKTGTPADLVLGQSDFAGHAPNQGRGDQRPVDGFSDAFSDGFFQPVGVASDGTHLLVADRMNNRILGWRTFPTKNGQPADFVLGQDAPSYLQPNHGNGPHKPALDGFNLPTAIVLAGSSLWVADTENNRAVRWDDVWNNPKPALFVGQPDGNTNRNPNCATPNDSNEGALRLPQTDATSMLRPPSEAAGRGTATPTALLAGGPGEMPRRDADRIVIRRSAGVAGGRGGSARPSPSPGGRTSRRSGRFGRSSVMVRLPSGSVNQNDGRYLSQR